MIHHSLDDIYRAAAENTRYSSIEIKRVVTDVFSVVKDLLDTYPDKPSIRLDRLLNIQIRQDKLKEMLKKRIMNDEDRQKWQHVLDMVIEFNNNRTRNDKKDDNEIST